MEFIKSILDRKIDTMPPGNVGPYYLKHLTAWYGPLFKRYYKYLARYCIARPAKLGKGSRILDVGCGVGTLVYYFNRLGYEARGIDIDQSAIECSLDPCNCNLVKNSSELPFPDRYFDLIVSREVLEHISPCEIDSCMDEWERVGNGLFIHIIAVKERGKRVIDDPAHFNVQIEDWWIKKFRDRGYNVIRKPFKFYYYPYGSEGYLMIKKDKQNNDFMG